MKKLLLAVFSIGFVIALCAGIWLAMAINNASAPGPLTAEKMILIERGKGVSAIADKLAQEGVISSALIFKIVTKLDTDQRPLKAGEYQFLPAVSMTETVKMMRDGRIYDRKITFPEGVTSWQVVEALKKQADMSGEIPEIPPEGTLLPDTYHYINQEDRAGILTKMKEAMDKTLAELWEGRTQNLPVSTPQEALILASIVEKETGVADERKRVAGVFVNRLRTGMPLQTDPTVIYGMTMGKIQTDGQGPIGRRLLTKDLATDTPYNTYLNVGLPPGPIANPGRASIEAALHPEEHDFYYFVADGKGGHVFARTLAEHNRNVASWRKIRNAQ
ncbi:MAG: endolytic transglycosylase MltG [Micavibrio aeruginosavorus]|uniref:Endolytic murein transglycosylase n=1 Tax=Micavibrio aeruginosavorus TaxID=349221 RepID=A0A2W5A1G2_9BACT|nr:MAG: endolytic transglycosylase MltG [Micavibrio aeruginosavorus]